MEQSIKVFVPLGTQKFQFNRLVEAFNQLIDDGVYRPSEVVMQSAVYEVEPQFTHYQLIPSDEFNRLINEAEVVVTHSGVNSIITCMNLYKPLVIVPRLHKFGEHVDNHQVEIAELMEEKFGVLVLKDMHDLKCTIEEAKKHNYQPWKSQRDNLIEAIKGEIVRELKSR